LRGDAFDVAAKFDLFRQQRSASRAIFGVLVWEVYGIEPSKLSGRVEDGSLGGHCLIS
jgi:hypothetical protein